MKLASSMVFILADGLPVVSRYGDGQRCMGDQISGKHVHG